MRAVADKNIVNLELFAKHAEIIALPAEKIDAVAVKAADILLTRSKTKLNSELLAGSAVKFIGCCVTGRDHIDETFLKQAGIECYVAEGCNAQAVVDYVKILVAGMAFSEIRGSKAAVIGVGRIGSLVADYLKSLGFEVLLCDPFRSSEPGFLHTDLAEINDVDLISLHVPLLNNVGMLDAEFFKRQKAGAILINTSRGEAINEKDLLEHGKHLNYYFDVFCDEPDINPDLVKMAKWVTPHIAGHSVEAKQRGSLMVYQVAAKLFGWDCAEFTIATKPEDLQKQLRLHQALADKLQREIAADPRAPGCIFQTLRQAYWERYEF